MRTLGGDDSAEPGRTVGVEEEFLLADAHTGAPAARAGAVLGATGRDLAGGTVLQPELFSSQVETASGVCTALSELDAQLVSARERLAAAARPADLRVLAAGTPPLPGSARPAVSAGDRFERVARTYRAAVADYQACGLHVHVGLADRELAVAVLNHLRPWLPALLALSVNSPLHLGSDTGYGSWRMVQQSRFPGSGVPPQLRSAADHDEQIAKLVDCGVLVDPAQSFWLARPSPHLPTIEFRVADTAITAREAVAQAALCRALVRTALAELRAGREAPPVRDQFARAAVWCAARDGLAGYGVHVSRECRVPAPDLVSELIERAAPALAETGDLQRVRSVVSELVRHGTGAQRQRAAAAAGVPELLDLLAAGADSRTERGAHA